LTILGLSDKDENGVFQSTLGGFTLIRTSALICVFITTLMASSPGTGQESARLDRGPGYARTTWATVHGDSRNSDYVPLETPLELREAWRILEGAAIWTAPSVAADGTLYVSSGRGRGTSHLHAISPAGQFLWESTPAQTIDDLDAGAVTSAPVLDDTGRIYIGDENQFWAFQSDGSVAWVTDVAALGAPGPFVTALLVGDRVGGISVTGQMIMLDRKTGALAVPVLELPGGPSPEGPEVPDWFWGGGLMDPETRNRIYQITMGYRFEVTNTAAVHPRTGRVYLLAGGRSEDEGLFYGIDLTKSELRIAFQTPVPAGTGTSPAISPDGTRVFAFTGDGRIFAVNADTGAVLFEQQVDGMPASPSVAPDGSVYVLAATGMVKVNGKTGEILWSRNYDDFAAEKAPTVSRFWPFVVSGKPIGRVDSVITITKSALWTSIMLGYELKVFGRELTHATSTFLVALEPERGDILASYPIPDTSEGGISVGPRGQLYMDLLALRGSVAAAGPYRWFLPPALRMPPVQCGIIAFEPN
jgi:outer membrane protein assembly factor BamB